MIIEKYLWANLTTLLAIYDKDDNLVQRYNYTESRTPTSMTMNNETYYLHYDQVGTLRVVTDKNKNIVKEISYDTYGNILSEKNPSFTVAFGFGGGLRDRDTNLVHFGYREYEPYTGKWTAKDPIDFSGGDSNLYGYVLGDPVNLVDPEGKNAVVAIVVELVPIVLFLNEFKTIYDTKLVIAKIYKEQIRQAFDNGDIKQMEIYKEKLTKIQKDVLYESLKACF